MELDAEKYVRFGIDSGIQPVTLIVESDHGFVECNVVRLFSS